MMEMAYGWEVLFPTVTITPCQMSCQIVFFSNLLQGQQYHSFNEEGVKTVGRPLFRRTGANIANDVASGKNIRDSLNTQVNQTANTIFRKKSQMEMEYSAEQKL